MNLAKWLRERAQEVSERPERWTKTALSQDANGKIVKPDSVLACRWCFYGLICRDVLPFDALELLEKVCLQVTGTKNLAIANGQIKSPEEFSALCKALADAVPRESDLEL